MLILRKRYHFESGGTCMQWKRKAKFTIIVMAVVLAVLAGCSSSDKGASGESPSASSASPTASPSAEPSTSAEPSPSVSAEPAEEKIDFKGKPIRIAQWWGMVNYLSDEDKERQKKVEEKYNTKIEYIDINRVDIPPRLITSSVAGQPMADVLMIPVNFALPKLAVEGYIQPVDDLIDLNDPKWNLNMKTNGKFDGKQYSFTDKDNNGNGFFYNKTMIQKAGFEDPYVLQEKGEWTWDKFLEIAKGVTKDGKFGVQGEQTVPNLLINSFVYTNDAVITTADNKIGFDSPNALEALQFVSDLYNVHKVVGGKLEEGTAAFHACYRWCANKDMAKSDDWGLVFYPKGPKGTDYVVPSDDINLWHLAAGTENPKWVMTAWQELYEMDPEKGYDAQLLLDEPNFKNPEGLDTLRKMFGKAILIKYSSYVGFASVYEEALGNIISGKGTPASEMARIKPVAQAAIDVTLKK